jgi:hypothetical protein
MLAQRPYALRWLFAAIMAASTVAVVLRSAPLGGSAERADKAAVRTCPGLQPRVGNRTLPMVGLSPLGTCPLLSPPSPAIPWDDALHEGGGPHWSPPSHHVVALGGHLVGDAAWHLPVSNVSLSLPHIAVSLLRPPLSPLSPVHTLLELSLLVCRDDDGASEWGSYSGAAAARWSSSVDGCVMDFGQQRVTTSASLDSVCFPFLAHGPRVQGSLSEVPLLLSPLAVVVRHDQPLVFLAVMACLTAVVSCLCLLSAFLYHCHYSSSNDIDTSKQPDDGTYSQELLFFTAQSCTLVGRCRLCPHARGRRFGGFGTRFRVLGPSRAAELSVYWIFIDYYCSLSRAAWVLKYLERRAKDWDVLVASSHHTGNAHAPPASSNPLRSCPVNCTCASSGDGSVDPDACHTCDPVPRSCFVVRWICALVALLLLVVRIVSFWFVLRPLFVVCLGALARGYTALIKLLTPRTLTHTTMFLLLAAALLHTLHTPTSPVPHPSPATCPGSFTPRAESGDVVVNTTCNTQTPEVVGTLSLARLALAVTNDNFFQQTNKVRSAVFTATTYYEHHVNSTPCFVQTRTGAITHKRVDRMFLDLTDNNDKLPRCVPLLVSNRTREASSGATPDQIWSSYPDPWSPFALSVINVCNSLLISIFMSICINYVVLLRTALLLSGSVTMLSFTARVCNRYIARHTCVSSHTCNPCRDPGRGIFITPQDPVLCFTHWGGGQPRRSCLVDHAVRWIESSDGAMPSDMGSDTCYEHKAQVTPGEGLPPSPGSACPAPSHTGSDEEAPAIAVVGLTSYGQWAVDLCCQGWVACCSLQDCIMPCCPTHGQIGSWFWGLTAFVFYNQLALIMLPSWWLGFATFAIGSVVVLLLLAMEVMYALFASVPFALIVALILSGMRAAGSRFGGGPCGSPRYAFAAAAGLHVLRFSSLASVGTASGVCLVLGSRFLKRSQHQRDIQVAVPAEGCTAFSCTSMQTLPDIVVPPAGLVPRPRRVMMARDDSQGSIKRITATRSFELHDQLFEWRDLAFQRIANRSNRIHESTLIHQFKQDLGADSALRAFAEAPSGTAQYPDMTAEEIATQISIVDNTAKRGQARASSSGQETLADKRDKAFDSAVKAAYQAWIPCVISPDLVQFKRQADAALAVDFGTKAHWKQAEADSRVAEASIAAEKAKHDGKSTDVKWAELAAVPDGIKQVKFAMDAFELRHGRGNSNSQDRSESSAANLPDHEMLPYRSPDDLRGITWLIQFCIFRTGGFTQEDVQRLMRMNMKPGESPLQAAARVVRYAQILQDAGIPGFDKDYRLWDLLTNQSRAGGPFFTRALYDKIEVVVNAELKRLNLHREHSAAALRVWIQVADEHFTAARGHNLELDRKIQEECNKRSQKQNKDAKGTPAAAANSGAKTGQGPNTDPKAGNKWCSLHGYNQTHASEDCRSLQRQLKAAEAKRDDLVRMATTIPQAGANLVDKGTRPGAAYNNNRTQDSGDHPAARRRDDKSICKVCSDLAGHSVEHRPDSCFMQQGVRVPEWFQPIDAKRRGIVNDKRAAQGLPRLPDVQPRPAGKAYATAPLDCPAGVPASEYRVMAMIGRTGLQIPGMFDHVSDERHPAAPISPSPVGGGAAAPLPAEGELEFISSTRRFICRLCHTLCEVTRNPYNGELLSVKCGTCRTWAASELPYDWSSRSRWSTDPSAMPELFRTPSRAPRVVVRSETIARDLNSRLPAITVGRSLASSSASNTLASLTGRPDMVTHGRTLEAPPIPFLLGQTGEQPSLSIPDFNPDDASDNPHAFSSLRDQILFGCILDDFQQHGSSSRLNQVSHILAGTSADARKFHLERIDAARQTWAAAQPATPVRHRSGAPPSNVNHPSLNPAPVAGQPGPSLQPVRSSSVVSADPAAAAAGSAPSGLPDIPDPRAGLMPVQESDSQEEYVSLGAGLGDVAEPSGMFMHSSFPHSTVGADESGFEPAHTPDQMRASSRPGWESAPLGTDSHTTWVNNMALDFVPRTEFDAERQESDLISNRVTTLEDQMKSVRFTAETAAMQAPSADSEVRIDELDSRLAHCAALTRRALAELQLSNDPTVTTSTGTVPELMNRVWKLELREPRAETNSAAAARPPAAQSPDFRLLLSETEVRVRTALDLRATTQAVDLLSQNVETAKGAMSDHVRSSKACFLEQSTLGVKTQEAVGKQAAFLKALRNDLDILQTKVNRVSSRAPVAAGSDPLPSPSEAMQAEVNELASKIGDATAKILLLEGERDIFRREIDTLRASEHTVVAPLTPSILVPNPSQGALDDLVAKFDAMAVQVAGLGSNPQDYGANTRTRSCTLAVRSDRLDHYGRASRGTCCQSTG